MLKPLALSAGAILGGSASALVLLTARMYRRLPEPSLWRLMGSPPSPTR